MRIPECTVTLLGTGSALPIPGRHPSAQMFSLGETGVLIDCGEGTQMQFSKFGLRRSKIDIILVSHLHGDHVFGLPGLISSFTHLGREKPLKIFGPVGIAGFLNSIRHYSQIKIQYPIEIIELESNALQPFFETDGLRISCFPLFHRIPAIGYLLEETTSAFRFNEQWVIEQKGNPQFYQDIRIKTEKAIEIGSPLPFPEAVEIMPSIRYAYCSDTLFSPILAEYLKGTFFIYHETTFLDELQKLASETGHSTAREAGKLAKMAAAGWLITGHYSSRYQDIELLASEARTEFDRVIMGKDGLRLDLRKMLKELTDEKKNWGN